MIPTSEIIRQLLIDESLGSDGGTWPVFISFLPNTPENTICVYDTAGMSDGRVMRTGERVEHHGIQIRVRGSSYLVARAKAYAIAEALDAQRRVSIALSSEESYTLHNVSRSGTVVPIGVEEEGDRRRHHFTVNAVTTITKDE
jgi:hypothetical protein